MKEAPVTGNFRGPARPQDAPQPDDEPFPDDGDWPDDRPGDPWSAPPQFQPGGPGGGPPGKRNPWLPIALTAALAGAAGVIIALLISGSPGTPSAGTTPGGAPSAVAPSLGGNGISGGPGGGVSESLLIGGKVTAITSHSITLSAGDHSVTAAINSSTRFTGQVHSASGIKPGDLAAARITGHAPDLVAVTIQDPAQIP
jgi:hypothetical protein